MKCYESRGKFRFPPSTSRLYLPCICDNSDADNCRIGCMLQGAWFNAATVLVGGVVPSVKPNVARPLRFIRLVSLLSLTDSIKLMRAVP